MVEMTDSTPGESSYENSNICNARLIVEKWREIALKINEEEYEILQHHNVNILTCESDTMTVYFCVNHVICRWNYENIIEIKDVYDQRYRKYLIDDMPEELSKFGDFFMEYSDIIYSSKMEVIDYIIKLGYDVKMNYEYGECANGIYIFNKYADTPCMYIRDYAKSDMDITYID